MKKTMSWAMSVSLAACVAVVRADIDQAVAPLVDPGGASIGRATFEQTPSGVLMGVEVVGLTPGAHGIHLHAVGACTPDFGAAGGHINPQGVAHGLRNPGGPDNGDLPLLHVGADGAAMAEFFTARVSISGGAAPALLDRNGSAVVIHEHTDDHHTQPIGGAGGRVGCGVVTGAQVRQARGE